VKAPRPYLHAEFLFKRFAHLDDVLVPRFPLRFRLHGRVRVPLQRQPEEVETLHEFRLQVNSAEPGVEEQRSDWP
jgi:hypothetical protein